MIKELIKKNRSYRRYHQNVNIPVEQLRQWVDLARHSPSGANFQSLKYILSCGRETNEKLFTRLFWAAYLKDWPGPPEGERPSAYIVILGDTRIHKDFFCDHGIACQSMLLGAVEAGFGGCILASIDREGLRKDLAIEDHLQILLVLALGKPKEEVRIEYMQRGGDVKYWRDDQQIHHVPKRPLDEIILKEYA